ncbi:thymidine phosphorylase [Candidatus Gottesmanbacteria bacterium]|nr:thymidine phosphorylase [Candidatus Gottesmanbacteria bacterium]
MDKKTVSKQNNHSQHVAIDAIRKKLLGKKLTYREIFTLMDEIGSERLSPILTAYFAAAGFREGFSEDELFYLTKAMAETGETLHFKGVVADKHSTGGVAGTRTTMILVPIIAAAGIKIPKLSSRAITSPSGTADTMEVLANVTFSPAEIQKLVMGIGGCIVWNGKMGLAPADDIIIQVEQPLAFESFDKIIVSVMAKKIASGATHIVFDVPVGPTMKIQHFKDAEIVAKKFNVLARKFGKKIIVDINETREPAGRGVGPVLECRDVLRVLEQDPERPLALEAKALRLSTKLLDLCYEEMDKKKVGTGEMVAAEILKSGQALKKMREIIKAQKGNSHIKSTDLKLGKYKKEIMAYKKGVISSVDNFQISAVAKILGSPADRAAGIFLQKRIEEKVGKDDILCTLYSSDSWKLKEAVDTLDNMRIFKIE